MAIIQAKYFIKRMFSSSTVSKNALHHLKERSIIQVKGPDASDFLQGLITNDINHLSDKVGSMYTMFLNTKGRVLYDTIIYKTEQKDRYFIECDVKATSLLQKHLNVYKIRRKVEICNLHEHKIHVLYNANCIIPKKLEDAIVLTGDYDTSIFPENSSDFKIFKDLLIFKDPRVVQLGFRIISRNEENIHRYFSELLECEMASSYKRLRYRLGIGEGTEELLVGMSFPLECNCDYLHGISFHKGCYIGQELTARTYHTGVIRKRLMPLYFSKIPSALPENNIIVHNKENLGKLRGIEGTFGLALLRIRQALKFETIAVGDGEATVIKPEWWPIELPKEKLNIHAT